MFNKFKSRKEEAKYEEMYKGTKDELYEEDLDKIVGGVNNNQELQDDDELSLDELDKIRAGIPPIPEYNGKLEEGTYINEKGEIIREGRRR